MSKPDKAKNLIARFSEQYGVDSSKLFQNLKTTAFKPKGGTVVEATDAQMMGLMIVADQYGLNPFTREIYAFPAKGGEIIPVVSVDGWSRIINDHPQFDGLEFVYSEQIVTMPSGKPCPDWIEVSMYRKDRSRPIVIREYLDETYQPKNRYDGPWQTHTKRMLRHKALIQCARVAFGFSGISDPDEAERIDQSQVREMGAVTEVRRQATASAVVQDEPQEAEEIIVYPEPTQERKAEMADLLGRLVERCKATDSWAAAEEYLGDKFAEGDLQYALEVLASAKDSSEVNESEAVADEACEQELAG